MNGGLRSAPAPEKTLKIKKLRFGKWANLQNLCFYLGATTNIAKSIFRCKNQVCTCPKIENENQYLLKKSKEN